MRFAQVNFGFKKGLKVPQESEFTKLTSIADFLSSKEMILNELASGKYISEILNFSPEFIENLYNIALELLDNKNYEDAADALLFIVNIESNESRYWISFGLACQIQHRYDEAIDAYEVGSSLDDANPAPFIYLAKCFFAIHERENALEAINIAIELAGEEDQYSHLKEEAIKAKNSLLDQFS